ncbi:MAG: hydroxypyruvate isomerase [Betaproteobacteria bacterium]|nr:hydroxypyruvate isomerase [Betaproteobacteria bacterium]MBL8535518.1 hydroxypyruvate isomerase [Betaproteobacteria bacterium]
MPKFNANLSMMFNEVPFLERFGAAARAGFKGVEFLFPYDFQPQQIRDELDRHRLEMVLFNMPPGDFAAGDRGLACDPARAGEFKDGVGKSLEYAKVLGVKRLHVMAGLKPRGVGEETMRETYLQSLRYAGAEAAKAGLEILIEAINTRDIPGFYLNTSDQAFDVMHYASVPNLRFQYDIYHMQIMEGDLAPTIEKHLAKIGHMQLADTPGRHEPGTGEINYDFLFRHIDKVGYTGWIGCEYRPAGRTEDGLGWMRPYL